MSAPTTYVITGASRGLGLEFVKQLSTTDSIIFALARNPSNSKDLQELVKQNKNIHTAALDVTNEASIKAAAEEVAKIAPNGVDILINNAGIGGEAPVNNLTITRKDYLRIIDTNVFGVSDVTQAFVPLLRKCGQDKTKQIVNISSGLGSIALVSNFKDLPIPISPAYNVSKAALNMLTKLTADQLAEDNIVVTSLHPGWVKTELGTEHADISPEESISGMLAHLGKLTAKDSGLFFNYDGTPLPW